MHCSASGASMDSLQLAARLNLLSISYCVFGCCQGMMALRSLTALSNLSLEGFFISSSILDTIACCERLNHLSVSCRVQEDPAKSLQQLTQLSELTSLRLRIYHVGECRKLVFNSKAICWISLDDLVQIDHMLLS